MSDSGDNIWTVLSSLAWPVGIGVVAFAFRDKIFAACDELIGKLRAAKEIKIGSLELKGEYFAPKGHTKIAGNDRAQVDAKSGDLEARESIYKSSRYLMLAHKIRPATIAGQKFDISIFLVRKMRSNVSTADFSEIESVEYYLGNFFGEGKFGSKFVVRDPQNGFAMKTSAYGPPLCVATINFRDGQKAIVSRFLDFEMGDVFLT